MIGQSTLFSPVQTLNTHGENYNRDDNESVKYYVLERPPGYNGIINQNSQPC